MSTQRTLLGALIALPAGAAIGILLAPRSGKETREILRKKGNKAKDDLNDLLDHGFERWKEVRNQAAERAHMTKEEMKDFLRFMAAEGADLKERIAADAKHAGKGAAEEPTNN